MADVEVKGYKADQFIFREGEIGDMAFVVKSGNVEIVKQGEDDNEISIGTVGPGDMFGEMALIDDKPRMASAKAVDEGATLMLVTREMFDRKMAKTDPFIRGLLNILADHVRRISKSAK